MLRIPPSRSVCKFLAFSALCIVPVAMNAATLFSENFDELTPALGVTSTGGFSTDGTNNIDILGPSLYNECFSPESVNCLDLNGSPNGPGSTQGSIESI